MGKVPSSPLFLLWQIPYGARMVLLKFTSYDKVIFILRSNFSNEKTLLILYPFVLRKGNLSLQKQENIPIRLPLWVILYSQEGLFFSLFFSPSGFFHIIYFSLHDSLLGRHWLMTSDGIFSELERIEN